MAESESSLSSPPASEDEMPVDNPPVKPAAPQRKTKKKNGTILSFFEPEPPSPPRRKRPASPPHEYVPEDNPDIAFIVMFRSRFTEAFPAKCPHFGPQDIERGVADPEPSTQIEALLCALLGLVLNRKKPVEKGHYGRALEEAISTQRSQWPRKWNYSNPLSGGRSFNSMAPSERVTLLHTLVLWSLNQSEQINTMIKEAYKSRTIKDRLDTNIPLSVQPWGRDGDKRRYWLVEGQDDTAFRVYRESNPHFKNVAWFSVAGSIDELRALATKLSEEDGTKDAKALSERILNAIPRFEATEVKRQRREYRIQRKNALARPTLGFSLYEGRTRGKRARYTFDDEDADDDSDAQSVRRSGRHAGIETSGPTVTASGRQVRSRATGLYGAALLSGQTTECASPATGEYMRSDVSEEPAYRRSTRAANKATGGARNRKHIETYNAVDSMDEESFEGSWEAGDDDEEDNSEPDDDDENDMLSDDEEPQHLVVTLRYPKGTFNPRLAGTESVARESTMANDAPAPAPAPAPQQPSSRPLSGVGALRQPEPEPEPLAPNGTTQTATMHEKGHQPTEAATTNGYRVQDHAGPPPFIPQPQQSRQQSSTHELPKLEGFFSAPTPPPRVQEQTGPKSQAQQPYEVATSGAHSPRPFTATLPTPTPASTWQ